MTGSTATHTILAWMRPAPPAVTVVVRSAHRGPVAEQNVASRSRWPRRGQPRMVRAHRRTSQS